MNLSGKTIVVTGASSGIGSMISRKIAESGGTTILFGRDQTRLESVYKSLQNSGHLYYSTDITNSDNLEGIIADAVSKTGKISGFVHSAGIQLTLPFRSTKLKSFQEIFAINVFAGFEMARVISKNNNLNTDQGTSFVFISSMKANIGEAGNVAYCASKSALISGSKAIAIELANKKVRSNCILPGFVKTEMTDNFLNNREPEILSQIIKKHPLGLGSTVDIANLAVFLLSDLSSWITGTEIVIDGGYTAQ